MPTQRRGAGSQSWQLTQPRLHLGFSSLAPIKFESSWFHCWFQIYHRPFSLIYLWYQISPHWSIFSGPLLRHLLAIKYMNHKWELTCYFSGAGVDPSGEQDKERERTGWDRFHSWLVCKTLPAYFSGSEGSSLDTKASGTTRWSPFKKVAAVFMRLEGLGLGLGERERERERLSLWLCMCKQHSRTQNHVEVMRCDLTAEARVSKQPKTHLICIHVR